MDKTAVLVCCVLLCAGAATAFPGSSLRRAAEESNPDREVEVVEPVRRGGARPELAPAGESDESPELVPFGIGVGLRGLGFGGRPVLAIRPLPAGRDSVEASDEEADYGGGYLNPYFIDPMSNFMAQMAEMMAAMRRQMSQVLDRLPAEGADLSKLGNTTSTTKVVDGHVITVNETIIGGEDGDDSVVHIRVIDVHPSESPESAEADSDKDSSNKGKDQAGQDADKDVESLSADDSDEATSTPNRSDNEIPMKPVAALKRTARAAPRVPGRGDMASDDDDGDDEDDVQQYQMAVFEPDTQQSQMPMFEEDSQQVQLPVYGAQQAQRVAGATGQLRLLPASNNQVEVFDKPRPRPADLSRDTLVNRVLEQQHRHAGLIMVDPDAELMEVRDGKVVGVRSGRPGRQTQTRRTEARASAPW